MQWRSLQIRCTFFAPPAVLERASHLQQQIPHPDSQTFPPSVINSPLPPHTKVHTHTPQPFGTQPVLSYHDPEHDPNHLRVLLSTHLHLQVSSMTEEQFIRSGHEAPSHPSHLEKDSSFTFVSRVTDPSASNSAVVSHAEAKFLAVSRNSDLIRVQCENHQRFSHSSAELAKLEYTQDHPRGLNWAHSPLDNTVRTPWQIAQICVDQKMKT